MAATIGANTVLDYTIVPNPVHTGGAPQDIVIIATLKTDSEFGQALKSATIEKIKFDFGPATSDANSLTSAANAITAANFKPGAHWGYKDAKDAQGHTVPNQVEVTPKGSGEIIDTAMVLTVRGVHVNANSGLVAITITETVSKINGSASLPPPLVSVNQTSINLAKSEEKSTSENTFSSNHYFINAGNEVTLTWNIKENSGPISLHYIVNDQLVNTATPTAQEPYPGITKHTDGTALQSVDTYPNAKYGDPEATLKLNETTIFILEVASSTPVYLSLIVIVDQAGLQADSLTIGNPPFSGTQVRLYSQVQVADGESDGVFIVPNDTAHGFVFRKSDDPTKKVTNLFQVSKLGHLYTGDSGDNGILYIPNQSKGQFYFRSGDDKSYQDLAQISNSGDLNVEGNITVGGTVSTTKQFVVPQTFKSVFGWGQGAASWTTGDTASSGGITLAGLTGFSATKGSGNFGYYWMNFGGVLEGTLEVDMYIALYAGSGQAFFNIMSSTIPLSNSGTFTDVSCSREIWSTTQSPSWHNCYNGAYIIRKLVRTHFHGQYIYIGGIDLGQGSAAVRINNVSAFAQT